VLPERHLRLSSSLAESYNPLLVLSSDDLKSMDQEVDDIFNETDDESAMDRDADTEDQDDFKTDDDESQDVATAMKRSHDNAASEGPTVKLPKDEFNDNYDSDSENSEVESELSEMGLALEREFLSD
jgi:hypothetical protein